MVSHNIIITTVTPNFFFFLGELSVNSEMIDHTVYYVKVFATDHGKPQLTSSTVVKVVTGEYFLRKTLQFEKKSYR